MDMEKLDRIIETMEEKGIIKTEFSFGDIDIFIHRDGTNIKSNNITVVENNEEEASENIDNNDEILISMNVGTFYRSVSRNGNYVRQEGDEVKTGDIIAYIEVMRVMHDVRTNVNGVIKEFLVEDGAVVSYGQPLVKIGRLKD